MSAFIARLSSSILASLTMVCTLAVEKVPGRDQHQARPGDEEWKVYTGHKDMPEVLTIGQRSAMVHPGIAVVSEMSAET